MPPSGGRPASSQPRRKRCASATASSKSPAIAAAGEQPLDGEVVGLAEEGQLTPPSRVAAGCLEVARGQVDHRRHVEGVRVLPRHLDVVGPRRDELEAPSNSRDGLVQLAADQA